jgi:hypothetical protein
VVTAQQLAGDEVRVFVEGKRARKTVASLSLFLAVKDPGGRARFRVFLAISSHAATSESMLHRMKAANKDMGSTCGHAKLRLP